MLGETRLGSIDLRLQPDVVVNTEADEERDDDGDKGKDGELLQ